MTDRLKVIIVTIDKKIAAELSLWLVQMGYSITGIEESISNINALITNTEAELVIFDFRTGFLQDILAEADGEKNHAQPTKTKKVISEMTIPICYLMDSEQHEEAMKQKNNHNVICYPFTKQSLKFAIDSVALTEKRSSAPKDISILVKDEPLKIKDRIFVRHKERMVKLEIEHILYIEADSNYSRIFSKEKSYLLATTLKTMEAKLPDSHFFRIHRSYIVNLKQIDEVAETHLVIARKALPISKSLRSGLMRRLQTI
ncbi:LytR/AlgR family response regulator transcription factor [Portibacter marinus]|uniref:LytR/AlgR family response regulator transcription factor n=1 Tax=Portibacter marinus TaxID=2898660 RepID=UPI001F263960|nr:LytTR family DNA-binding domain-containing protein [Portibacter marinus]